MKMSEEFDLPLRAEGDIYSSGSEIYIGSFESNDFDKAAVHAINNHDALVELNKELVKALDFATDYMGVNNKRYIEYCDLINKARKELTND